MPRVAYVAAKTLCALKWSMLYEEWQHWMSSTNAVKSSARTSAPTPLDLASGHQRVDFIASSSVSLRLPLKSISSENMSVKAGRMVLCEHSTGPFGPGGQWSLTCAEGRAGSAAAYIASQHLANRRDEAVDWVAHDEHRRLKNARVHLPAIRARKERGHGAARSLVVVDELDLVIEHGADGLAGHA
eukprot:scaffold68717_cov69-Phaeocystis_antarctica.AAC.7